MPSTECVGSSDSDSYAPASELAVVFEKRLVKFFMKDCMLAAYFLDPINFTTENEGATFQLPWGTFSDDELNKVIDEIERRGGENALVELQRVKSNGMRFMNKLNRLKVQKSVAALCAKKDGVVTVRPVSDRKSVWSSALKKEFPRGVNTHPFLHVRSSRYGLEDAFGSSATTGGLLPRCRYVFPPESHFFFDFRGKTSLPGEKFSLTPKKSDKIEKSCPMR
jgi:hypothetical protein